jgi:glycosyltransferase involved in cell wall biosynthesis
MVFLSRRVFNKKTSIYVHGGGFDRYYDGLSRWARKVVNKTFRSADNFIVQTRHLGNRFSADFQNIAVVPNWTKIPGEFHPDVKKRRSSAQSKLDQVRFVFCGEVRAEKGIQELFLGFQNAADKLRQKDIYISLDIFGQINSTFQETFNRLLEEFKSAGVIYNGYLTHPELMERLPQFDVLVLPTYLPTEGYPGVIIEGMSFGLPVIASRWRALPELVIEGRNGLLIEPQNHADLAEKMMEIARDDQLRSFLGSNAREEALNYDVNTVLPDLCKLIGLFEYKV